MSAPGFWERTATEVVNKVVEANACKPWKELRRELIHHGHLFSSSASWPMKMYRCAKRKVLDGTAWELRVEPPPRTHTEAVKRMLAWCE